MKIHKITVSARVLNDKELVTWVVKTNEPVFEVKNFPKKLLKSDNLVDLEVSLRKGKRVGLIAA